MTIKKQKILRLIPIVQLLTVFFWLKDYFAKKIPWTDFFKCLLKMFGILLLIHIPRAILHFIFGNDILDNILYYISLYPSLLGISWIAVADQELHEKKECFPSCEIQKPIQSHSRLS